MFQPNVLFAHHSDYSSFGKGDWLGKKKVVLGQQLTNSTLFPEGEGVTATCLGQRPSRGGKYQSRNLKIIHRVPSVEGATATCLGILNIAKECKKINRKNAPNELSLFNNDKKRRKAHGA